MAPMKQITLRMTSTQLQQLDKLSEKLHIDRANVMRLAVARLAEAENIHTPKRKT